MFGIKKINIITARNLSTLNMGVTKMLNFLDLIGYNIYFITKPKVDTNNSGLYHLLNFGRGEFKNIKEFERITTDKSELFRVNLIVVDLWDENIDNINEYKRMLNATNIDYIILTNTFHYIESDSNTSVSMLEAESNGDYSILDMINDDKRLFSSYVLMYKRNIKLDYIKKSILGDDEPE